MTRRVAWSDLARADLLGIVDFIARENPDAAERVADQIEAVVAGLASFATGRAGRVAGTYEKAVGGLPFMLAYRIGVRPDGAETVFILHVVHGARDWPPGRWPVA